MSKRLPAIHVPHWLRPIAILCGVVFVLTIGAVYLPRLAPDSYHCLRYDFSRGGGDLIPFIADVHTGSFAIDQRSLPATQNADNIFPSPDGRYRVWYVLSFASVPKLYLESIGGEGGVLESNFSGDLRTISWHRNSQLLTYIVNPSNLQLIVIRPDSIERRVVFLGKPNAHLSINPLGIASDAAYYAFYSDDGKQQAYHFLRLSDLSEQRIILTDTSLYDFEWSPNGHWLSVTDRKKGILQIMSPESGVVRSYELPSHTELRNFIWSPDAKYVALLLMDSLDSWNWTLSVYGLDSQQSSEVFRARIPNKLRDDYLTIFGATTAGVLFFQSHFPSIEKSKINIMI